MLTAAIAGVVDHPCIKHRSLEMTLVYAKITDRVVADEYATACEQIDALYTTPNTTGAPGLPTWTRHFQLDKSPKQPQVTGLQHAGRTGRTGLWNWQLPVRPRPIRRTI
jgi:hypothetical protein